LVEKSDTEIKYLTHKIFDETECTAVEIFDERKNVAGKTPKRRCTADMNFLTES